MLAIAGFALAVSDKERKATRAKVLRDLPHRAVELDKPETLKILQRRGFSMFLIGIALLMIWVYFFNVTDLIPA